MPERLRALREAQKLTQQELAMRAGVSVRLVPKYETAVGFPKTGPDLVVLGKLARALGTPLQSLLFGEAAPRLPLSDDVQLSDELMEGLRALGIVPSLDEVRWLATAPFFKDMDTAGAFQALMGHRHGRKLTDAQAVAAAEARQKHHSDDVPRKRR